jgi:hypothetical protein
MMSKINVLQELAFLGKVGLEVSADMAELASGNPVTVDAVPIGTMNGRPVFLTATLTLGNIGEGGGSL